MPVPATDGGDQSWVAFGALGAGAVALLGLALLLLRGSGSRKRQRLTYEAPAAPVPQPAPPPPPVPVPTPVPAAPPPPAPRVTARSTEEAQPHIEIEFTPRRAGTNLTSAAVDYQVTLRNTGPVEARDITLGIYILTASAQQASDLQSVLSAPIGQPATATFALPPGADVQLSGMALLPRENVHVMTIDGKPWFVPVLAIKADYRWGENVGAPGIATAAYMIGIDRGEGAKLAPFRLDTGPHMHNSVSFRRVA